MTRPTSDLPAKSGPEVPLSTTTQLPLTVITDSAAETASIGHALADWLRDGDVVLLHGDLGAGKTTLAKGIAAALGVDAVVSSPSFSLINEYDASHAVAATRLYHLDLYRLQSEDDLASIGFGDFMTPVDGVTLVEWPERAATALPERFFLIEIASLGSASRRLRILAIPDDEDSSRRMECLRCRVDAKADSSS